MKELTPFSVLVKGLLQHSEVIVNLRLYQMQRWFRHVCPQSDSVWHTILCQSIPTTDPSALPHGAPQKKRKNAKANGWTSNQKVQVQITFCHRLLMWLQTSQSPRALGDKYSFFATFNIFYRNGNQMSIQDLSTAMCHDDGETWGRYDLSFPLSTSSSFLSKSFSVFPPYLALNAGHPLQVSNNPVSRNARCCTNK